MLWGQHLRDRRIENMRMKSWKLEGEQSDSESKNRKELKGLDCSFVQIVKFAVSFCQLFSFSSLDGSNLFSVRVSWRSRRPTARQGVSGSRPVLRNCSFYSQNATSSQRLRPPSNPSTTSPRIKSGSASSPLGGLRLNKS